MKSKKELKNEYKQMKFQMGVFQIKNLINNKVMIDSSINISAKWNRHKMQLNFGTHKNQELQKDWNTLGENNFTFEILSELKHKNEENTDYTKELELLEKMIVEDFENSNIILY